MKTTTYQKLCTVNAILNGNYDFVVMPSKHSETKAKLQALLNDKAYADIDDNGMPVIDQTDNTPNNIAVIPVIGELIKGGGIDQDICEQCGICDIDNVTAELKEAAADNTVQVICFLFDSGGGEVTGIRELAELIKQVGTQKLVIGACFTLCASGAYWLASQCSALFCNYSCTIGNVGCYRERPDLTKQLEKEGVKINIIQDPAAPHKTFGHPATEMSKDEEQAILDRVAFIGDEFRKAVISSRGVAVQYLNGDCFLGEQAVANNMADANVSDLVTLLEFFANMSYVSD